MVSGVSCYLIIRFHFHSHLSFEISTFHLEEESYRKYSERGGGQWAWELAFLLRCVPRGKVASRGLKSPELPPSPLSPLSTPLPP